MRKALSVSVLGLALLPWSCGKKPAAPPPPPTPSSVSSGPPSASAASRYFVDGEKYFESGDYEKAAQAYASYLSDSQSPLNKDRALFRLALTRALPGSPIRDLPLAMNYLRQIVARYPESPLRPQAELLLGLQVEIDKLQVDSGKKDERIRELSQELERLKRIDMQRRPAPSP